VHRTERYWTETVEQVNARNLGVTFTEEISLPSYPRVHLESLSAT
jgi:hypothetical protein